MKIDEYRSIAIHWHDYKPNLLGQIFSFFVWIVGMITGRFSETVYVTRGPSNEKLRLKHTLVAGMEYGDYYTLIADGRTIGEFYGWPHKWTRDYAKDAPVPKLSEGEEIDLDEAIATTENATLATWLNTPIDWTILSHHNKIGDKWIRCTTTLSSGENLSIAIGDFPAEYLFALLVDGIVIGGFNSWPDQWSPKLAEWPRATDNPPKCPHCGK